MKILMLSLLLLLLPLDAQAHQTDVIPTPDMVLAGGRVAGVPTPETALLALMAQVRCADSDPAVAVLRQVFDARPAAELDTLAADARTHRA